MTSPGFSTTMSESLRLPTRPRQSVLPWKVTAPTPSRLTRSSWTRASSLWSSDHRSGSTSKPPSSATSALDDERGIAFVLGVAWLMQESGDCEGSLLKLLPLPLPPGSLFERPTGVGTCDDGVIGGATSGDARRRCTMQPKQLLLGSDLL
eukprot:CAMPEP_0172728090 /NCGR_PEP_ID=MMETSP1074-20121228/92045_1 /TAXON_ID=2916 /ORGANISM="Ceratium fusus, Strain PA161109" /LENGTH=149 /DNA_ID=CAMNT_0013555305 /DNA_START=341 /DNA_END=791 /DNA_ORIENTATION=-